MYNNLKRIQVTQLDNGSIYLTISLDRAVDSEWERCYQSALFKKGTITSLRSSGAPTVNKVSFSGFFITTRPFPNNEFTKSDAKDFLNELDEIVGITDSLYDSLQKEKEEKRKKEEEEKVLKEQEKQDLESFFNN